MTAFSQFDDLQGAQFVDVNLRGARFVRSDLSGAVMRAAETAGADIEAELNRPFPGRAERRAADPDGLRAAGPSWSGPGR